jgi:uncharacterized membrane protein HdeD (DUF308 family)
MAEAADGFLERSKPWRADVRWQVVAVEAVMLVLLGAFMLSNTARAGNWLLQVIGLIFLVISLQLAVTSFRQKGEGAGLGAYDSFRAGIGVTVGIIATSLWWSSNVPNGAVRQILGWGLVAFPALQLIGIVVVRGRQNMRLTTIALSVLALALGIVLLTTDNTSADDRITSLGIVLLVFGVLLGGLAFVVRSRAASRAAPA